MRGWISQYLPRFGGAQTHCGAISGMDGLDMYLRVRVGIEHLMVLIIVILKFLELRWLLNQPFE